jgi:hypothetical protein
MVEHERGAMIDRQSRLWVVLIATDCLEAPEPLSVEVAALEVHVAHAIHELVEEQRPCRTGALVLLRVRPLHGLEGHGNAHQTGDLVCVQYANGIHIALHQHSRMATPTRRRHACS